MADEEPVYEAVTTWVRHEEKCRNAFLPILLRHVRLPLLSAKFITDVIDEEVQQRGTLLSS